MEKYYLEEDVTLFCVAASSFPAGIKDAFDKLRNLDPTMLTRDLFGISHQTREGKIIYKAATQEAYEGEGKNYGCETVLLKKGEYLTQTVKGWRKDEGSIASTFQRLLKTPDLDSKSFCVEWYKSKDDVMCMVRLETVANPYS